MTSSDDLKHTIDKGLWEIREIAIERQFTQVW
jgi:hypothetical protein